MSLISCLQNKFFICFCLLAGEFVNKICAVKEQYANSLLSAVETFRRKSAEIKKERSIMNALNVV